MKCEPNAPCPCGSGRKFKKCHRLFEEAPSHRKYAAAQEVYAKLWAETADLQYVRGDYAWMAEQLPRIENPRFFDIGVGSGQGFLALYERFGADLRYVGIDENIFCLRHAETTLKSAGFSAHLLARLDTTDTPNGFVQIGGEFELPLPEPITMIEADPLTDNYLEEALLDGGLFDAVTIWLTGAHAYRRKNAYSIQRGVRDELDLRIVIQNEAYELADRILRPGGVLQVLDRAEAPTDDRLRREYFKSHSEQAEPTTLKVKEINYRLWSPPAGAPTALVNSKPEDRPDNFPEPQLALVSIISEKT